MAKPTIITRASKGSALTWTEGDSNLTNLRDATIGITDGTNSGTLDLNDTLTFTAGTNITLSYNATSKSLTINSTGGGGGALNDLSDVTITTPSSNQLLQYNGSGWVNATVSTGITDLVQDTSPQLGGNLDVNGQQIVSVSNGNISIQPNGTGQTVVKNIEYNENIFGLGTTSGTITPNVANGNVQTITLNGNLTINALANPVTGQSLTLIINTNGTGRTLSSTMKFSGGAKTLSATSTTDILSIFYDGANYWASLSTDFK